MKTPAAVDRDELTEAVHVWHLCPEEQPDALEAAGLGLLAAAERAHYERLATPALRREYSTTRLLCRATLSYYTGVHPSAWTFVAGEYAKPMIAGPAGFVADAGTAPLRFNLTHTRGLVACAVTGAGEVGVDAEETSGAVDAVRVARHFFSGPEQATLAALSADRQTEWFFEQWVLKEAYLKGRGTGLSEPPDGFTVVRGEGGIPLSLDDWQLSLHRPTPRHVAAVAVQLPRGSKPAAVRWLAAGNLCSA
jgi:4'-phosphopantetheinyl transferase